MTSRRSSVKRRSRGSRSQRRGTLRIAGSPEVTYRFAGKEDLLRLAELNHQLIRDERAKNPMTLLQLRRRMQGWLASQYHAVIFESGSEIVGYALFRVDKDGVYLRQFFISREMRRRGYGRSAVGLLLEEVFPRGGEVTVEVLNHNRSALTFWRAVGFTDHARMLRILL